MKKIIGRAALALFLASSVAFGQALGGPLNGPGSQNAATATALAANGANCSAGSYPLGVDASGAAESCTAVDPGLEASTAGSGSPNILTSGESGKLLTNEGTTAENYHTLPTAAANLQFCFANQDSDGIRITANTADTIKLGSATVSASAGFVRSVVQGSVLCLRAINATEWFSFELSGEWTIDA